MNSKPIRIPINLKKKLDSVGQKNETYGDVLLRIIPDNIWKSKDTDLFIPEQKGGKNKNDNKEKTN